MRLFFSTLYLSITTLLLTGCLSAVADGAGAVVSATGSVISTTVKTTYDVVTYPFEDDEDEDEDEDENDDGFE